MPYQTLSKSHINLAFCQIALLQSNSRVIKLTKSKCFYVSTPYRSTTKIALCRGPSTQISKTQSKIVINGMAGTNPECSLNKSLKIVNLVKSCSPTPGVCILFYGNLICIMKSPCYREPNNTGCISILYCSAQ